MGHYLVVDVNGYQTERQNYGFGRRIGVIACQLNKCVFGLITLTMYHLYLGLSFVNQKYKKMSDVYKRQKIGRCIYTIFCLFSFAMVLYFIFCSIDVWNE